MKRFLATLVALTMAAFAANVTFQADFEDTVDAFGKNGTVKPQVNKDSTEIFDKGLDGKGVRSGLWQGKDGGAVSELSYDYDVTDAASAEKGAVSFWLKPVDWDGGVGSNKHRMFVDLKSTKNGDEFVIYKVLWEQNLYFYNMTKGTNAGMRIGNIANWKKGEWHHIAISWDNGTFQAFVDGEATAKGKYQPMKGTFTNLHVGKLGWKYEDGASVIDEIRLFDGPLTPEEAKGIFQRKLNITKAPSLIGIAKSSPKVDGVVAPDEYAFSGTGFIKISGIGISERQSRYSFGQDGKRLYLAVTTPFSKTSQFVAGRKRDGELWYDENIEWHIHVPEKGLFQFIVNPEGAIYDSVVFGIFDRKADWNSKSFETKNTIKDGVWTCECSVSLEELGCKDGMLSTNVARSFRNPDENTCIAAVRKNIGFSDKNAFINVRLLDKTLPAVRMDQLVLSLNRLSLEFSSKEPFDGNVVCSKGLHPIYEQKSTGATFKADAEKFMGGTHTFMKLSIGDDIIYQNEIAFENNTDKPLTLHYFYTELDNEDIIFKCSGFYPENAAGSLRLVFSNLKGEKVAEKEYPLNGLGMSFDITFPGATLPHGYYAIKGTHIDTDGIATDVIEEDWCRPEKHEIPDYLSTDYIKIQPPWTPLVQNGGRIDALVKSYEFNGGFLLSKVTANGNNILGEPMRLEINGKSDSKAKPPVFDNHGDFCFISQEADYGDVKVVTQSRMDYDGLVKVKMTVTPPEGGCTLSSLKLLMPFDAKNMDYINANGAFGRGSEFSGLLTDKVWTVNIFSRFSFWIGNVNSGFSWVATNMKGWHCQDVSKSLVVSLDGKLRTACLNIVDTPFRLDKPRTFEFGIMASPGRPESRKVNRMDQRDWTMWWQHDGKYFDYIDPNYIKPRAAGKKAFPYNSVGTAAHCPHWNYYQKEWNRKGLGSFSEDYPVHSHAERDRAHWLTLCLAPKTFMDFKIRQITYAIHNETMDVHNLYFDLAHISGCPSEVHGCSWKDDFGRRWTSCDWEQRRAFFQIIRSELLSKDPEGLLSFHTHNQRLPMITSFCDIQVGGEDFVFEIGACGNYYDLVDSDVLRSYSISYGLGPKCVFIPQFERSLTFTAPGTFFDEKLPKNRKAVRHLLTMLMMHDIDSWYATPETFALTKLRKDFGWDENTFFNPFWNTEGYFTILKDTTGGKFYITVFRREGRFLFMALNNSPSEAEAVIRLDLKRLLGRQPSSIKDFYEPERKHVLDNETLTLKLADREPAILWFE